MIYKHKTTGAKLKLLKKKGLVSTFLKVDKPRKQFWNRIIDNKVICLNSNVKIVNSEMIQGSLF